MKRNNYLTRIGHFTENILIIGTLLLSAGCQKQQPSQGMAAYRTQDVQPQTVTIAETYPASIQGKQDIQILPQVSGFITRLAVKEGEQVRNGQTLFEIDPVNFQAALRVAEANVQAAEAVVKTNELTYSSKQKLFDEKVISRYELQVAENALLTARASLTQAQAGVVNARQNLSYCTVKAPCNGVVGRLPYRVGSLVSPQIPEPLTTVSDNSEMYVYFSMTEEQMLTLVGRYGTVESALRQMPDVSLRLANNTEYGHTGRIESISGVIDRQTGAVSVRAVFPNPERLLFSGGSCNVIIPRTYANALVIPQAGTYEIQDKVFCFRIVDGRAEATMVDVTPMPDGKNYIVNSGLKAGERIIAEGAGLVKNGDKVE